MSFLHQKAAVDMVGQRFGRLVVQRQSVSDGVGRSRWLCLCDCGGEAVYRRQVLVAGEAKSCGCLHIETARANLRPHVPAAPIAPEPCTLAAVWR